MSEEVGINGGRERRKVSVCVGSETRCSGGPNQRRESMLLHRLKKYFGGAAEMI
jgi:hypothetical protein